MSHRALCLAWIGNNAEAVGCLERAVALDAEPAFDRAVEAWALALDAAETLLDNGHLDQARSLLATARDLACSTGRRGVEQRAQALLDQFS
jgi:hypothetical protein